MDGVTETLIYYSNCSNIIQTSIQDYFIFTSVIVAISTIYFSHLSAKKRAVLDYVIKEQSDVELTKAKETLQVLHQAEDDIANFANDEHKGSKESKAILKILSSYEFICAAIHSGAFHEGMYKKIYHTRAITDYNGLKGFIIKLRTSRKQQTLFQEFEKLGIRWTKNPLKNNN
jgi:hypothetical protein